MEKIMDIGRVKMYLKDVYKRTVLDDMKGPTDLNAKDGSVVYLVAFVTSFQAGLDDLDIAMEISETMRKRGHTMFSFYELKEYDGENEPSILRWGSV
jgi:hypothetical protein